MAKFQTTGRRLLASAFVAFTALLVPGLSDAQDHTVTVFAAASLKDALDAAVQSYAAEGHGKVVVSYAASATLAKQIENGAPADLFISANEEWMDYLAKRDLIDASIKMARQEGNWQSLVSLPDNPDIHRLQKAAWGQFPSIWVMLIFSLVEYMRK